MISGSDVWFSRSELESANAGANASLFVERIDHMFLPKPTDLKDAISQYAGFFGMVVSIAVALYLILPSGETLSNAPKLIVSILIGVFFAWLSFAIRSKK